MNDRIKELACKTLTRFDQDMDGSMEPEKLGDWIRYNDLEKFAELIIKECIDQVKLELRNSQQLLSNPPQNAGVWDACNNIRRHFGIK